MSARVPVVDVRRLSGTPSERAEVARELDAASVEHGFFSIIGHGVAPTLFTRLETQARAFFDLPDTDKQAIAMERGGRAWRGWFPVGGELTSGVADHKEGIYFGSELAAHDPAVLEGRPLHGPNLFPSEPAALRATVLEYLGTMRVLGMRVMGGLALGLGLDQNWFARTLMRDPITLLRVFRYPAADTGRPDHGTDQPGEWGVREHTDYGFLTIVHQDATGGLEIRGPDGWIDVPPAPDQLVCNLGDMLERVTNGRYRSTPHRVVRPRTGDRIAVPFFLDPSWEAVMYTIPTIDSATGGGAEVDRWDEAHPVAYDGTYGDYLLAKVSRVFPALRDEVL
jgi:isopenicillin N synthase-like dioxygenase